MARNTSAPAICRRCGQEWPTDPALLVPCPRCQQPAGSPCLRPSEHRAPDVHAERDRVALATVAGYGRCSGAGEEVPEPEPEAQELAPEPVPSLF